MAECYKTRDRYKLRLPDALLCCENGKGRIKGRIKTDFALSFRSKRFLSLKSTITKRNKNERLEAKQMSIEETDTKQQTHTKLRFN